LEGGTGQVHQRGRTTVADAPILGNVSKMALNVPVVFENTPYCKVLENGPNAIPHSGPDQGSVSRELAVPPRLGACGEKLSISYAI